MFGKTVASTRADAGARFRNEAVAADAADREAMVVAFVEGDAAASAWTACHPTATVAASTTATPAAGLRVRAKGQGKDGQREHRGCQHPQRGVFSDFHGLSNNLFAITRAPAERTPSMHEE
jgi:hypothetical protein